MKKPVLRKKKLGKSLAVSYKKPTFAIKKSG